MYFGGVRVQKLETILAGDFGKNRRKRPHSLSNLNTNNLNTKSPKSTLNAMIEMKLLLIILDLQDTNAYEPF